MILGCYAGKSHNLIVLGIFHGDLNFFDLHEKSLDLSNYEIFPHKILKSRSFKKSCILIVIVSLSPGSLMISPRSSARNLYHAYTAEFCKILRGTVLAIHGVLAPRGPQVSHGVSKTSSKAMCIAPVV